MQSGRWRFAQRLVPRVLLGAGCLFGAACGVGVPKSDSLNVDLNVAQTQVKQVLAEVFPDLSDEELGEYAAKLDLKAALALKLELSDIRSVADGLSKALAQLAKDAAERRQKELASSNDGYPTGIEPVGRRAFYDSAQQLGRIELSGVYDDRASVTLTPADVSVSVAGNPQQVELDCAPNEPVDIVFLVDITGSMSPVIGALRRSLNAFVTAITAKEIQGTLSVVTFQDSVGVNVQFEERAPASGYERSPFFKPITINDAASVSQLQRFISRLEANSGEDTPENLAGALDFARNNVIGKTSRGQPNVIGDGVEDPRDVAAFPKLREKRQIFVAFTDAPFHSDGRTPQNSSLLAPFKPRPSADILRSLQTSATTVHVSDPSWVDETLTPTAAPNEVAVDSDYWAVNTGGVGEDRVHGYSLIDLDLLVVAADTGLLDILLDAVLASSCSARFSLPELSAGATFDLEIKGSSGSFSESLPPAVF